MRHQTKAFIVLIATVALTEAHAGSKTPAGGAEACPSGVCTFSGAQKNVREGHYNLSTFEMKSIVDSGSAVILDARSGKYDDGTRIPGAKSLNDKSTPEDVAAVIPSKDASVVTYCSNTQCPASKRLADHLTKLGYTNIKEYPEGIAGWREAGGPVDQVK
jgi:rhodanese-related sulfurtransferase